MSPVRIIVLFVGMFLVSTINVLTLNDGSNLAWNDSESGNYKWAAACDYAGNDIAALASSGVDNCGKLCVVSEECTHFVWTTQPKGTCWLKKGEGDWATTGAFKTLRPTVCGFKTNGGKKDGKFMALAPAAK